MMNQENNMLHAAECKCITWQPIFAGALVALGLSFLLHLFSIAIGLTAFTTDSAGVETLALGGLIGTAIGIIASMFAAGWLTGYLGNRYCNKAHLGALYGFLTWCLAFIAGVLLATHVQDYVAFYGHFISGTASSTLQVGGNPTLPNVTMNQPNVSSLVISTYIVFGLFFLSAFACSLGGHCGMRHCCKKSCN